MANSLRRSALTQWLGDPFQPTEADAPADFRPNGNSTWLILLGLGLALLAVSLVGWGTDAHQFYFSYLLGWTFCISVAIGALFFVIIQHLTKARWSVAVRRIPEALLWSFPVLALLGIPVVLGMHDLYHWTHQDLLDPASPTYDAIIAGKSGYLNTPFFLLRMAFYFVMWSLVSYKLYRLSVLQDVTGDPGIEAQLRKVSAWGLPLAAVTTTFASWDLLMSLDPHWFSTIFGVYFFAGGFWTSFAFTVCMALLLQRQGMLTKVITKEHYQDLGKFMFGFTVFWAYIAFSQYMLIWYGNLPEETIFYRHRLEHGWEAFSAALLVFHFILPFFLLVSRGAKRNKSMMSVMVVWFFIMHWFDYVWIINPIHAGDHAGIHWLDVTCWLGLFLLMMGLCLYRLGRHSLVPHKSPYLSASLRFVNH